MEKFGKISFSTFKIQLVVVGLWGFFFCFFFGIGTVIYSVVFNVAAACGDVMNGISLFGTVGVQNSSTTQNTNVYSILKATDTPLSLTFSLLQSFNVKLIGSPGFCCPLCSCQWLFFSVDALYVSLCMLHYELLAEESRTHSSCLYVYVFYCIPVFVIAFMT